MRDKELYEYGLMVFTIRAGEVERWLKTTAMVTQTNRCIHSKCMGKNQMIS